MITPLPPRLLPLADAARYCSLPEETFKRLAREGVMPSALRLGRAPLWDRTSIDEALDRLKAVRVPLAQEDLSRSATPEEIALMRLQGGD